MNILHIIISMKTWEKKASLILIVLVLFFSPLVLNTEMRIIYNPTPQEIQEMNILKTIRKYRGHQIKLNN